MIEIQRADPKDIHREVDDAYKTLKRGFFVHITLLQHSTLKALKSPGIYDPKNRSFSQYNSMKKQFILV